MALFARKTTADEIIKVVAEMSDKDKQKVMQALAGKAEETSDATNKTETNDGDAQSTAESAVEKPEDRATEQSKEETTEHVEAEEQAPAQCEEATDGEQTEEYETEPVEETEEEHEAEDNVEKALNARFQSLESEISNLTEMMEKIVSRLEDKPFGSKPEPPQSPDNSGDDDRIMRGYYGKTYARAKV